MFPVWFLLVLGISYSTGCLETIKPCYVTDIDCLSKNTQKFMDCTSGGNPAHNILQIDPLIIPSLDIYPENTQVAFHFKDLNVTGFKDQKVSFFKLDKTTKAVHLKTRVDIVFDSDVTAELQELQKTISGTVKAEGSAEGSAQYTYTVKTDDKGVEHYEVGPETISCEASVTPKFVLDPEFLTAVKNDPDYKAENEKYQKVREATAKKIICDVVKRGFEKTVHNIRVTARVIPKQQYFKDV